MDKSGGMGPPHDGMNPPPPYMAGGPPPPQAVTVTTMNVVPVGPASTQLICPSCNATIATRVEHKASTRTHIIAVLLCLFLCWPCVCVPYCMDSCQNAEHYCPNCSAYLGTYKS